ncbi:MAG: histidine phosphatase family protein [Pseudomonadales bacterium]
MKHLWIIRHAKSSWADSGQADFERDLNQRGERDGLRMQAHLETLAHAPQWLWCSSAQRAQRTAQFVRTGFSIPNAYCQTLAELYHADAYQLLDVLQRTPAEITSVAVVAHNPGLTDLVNSLGDTAVTSNLPTFGVAHFCWDRAPEHDFSGLVFGGLRLANLYAPKTIDTAQGG